MGAVRRLLSASQVWGGNIKGGPALFSRVAGRRVLLPRLRKRFWAYMSKFSLQIPSASKATNIAALDSDTVGLFLCCFCVTSGARRLLRSAELCTRCHMYDVKARGITLQACSGFLFAR